MRESAAKLQKTQTEFIEHMVKKGKSPEWALTEWNRRNADTSGTWKKGMDKDTRLPTIAVYDNEREEMFVERSMTMTVEMGGAQVKNPKEQHMTNMIKTLADELYGIDAGNEAAFAPFAQSGSMSASLRGVVDQEALAAMFQTEKEGLVAASPAKKATASMAAVAEALPVSEKARPSIDDERFDLPLELGLAKPPLQSKITTLRSDIEDLQVQCSELVTSLGDDAEGHYSDTLAPLKGRQAILAKIGLEPAQWEASKAAELQKKDGDLHVGREFLQRLMCMDMLSNKVSSLGDAVSCRDELKHKVKEIEDGLMLVRSFMGSVKRLSDVVRGTRTTREREAINAEQNRIKQLAAASKKSAQAKAAPAPPSLLPAATVKFYDLNFEKHIALAQVADTDAKCFDEPWHTPASQVVARVLGSAPSRLNLMVFKAGFVKKRPPVKREHQDSGQQSNHDFARGSLWIHRPTSPNREAITA